MATNPTNPPSLPNNILVQLQHLVQMSQPTTEDEKIKALKKVKRATIELSSAAPFVLLSGMLAALRHATSDHILTAVTDGLNVVWNARWVLSMKPKQIAFVLAHEAGHSFFMHNVMAQRFYHIDKEKAAQAVDHVVNNFLLDCDPDGQYIQFPTLPDGSMFGVCDRKYRGMSTHDVFKDLLNNSSSGKGGGGGFDSHDFDGKPLKPEDEKELDMARQAGKRAAEAAASRQVHPDEGKAPKQDWRARFARWLYARSKGRDQATWKQPNRRMIGQGIYLPSQVGKGLRRAVFASDTSGSIQSEELASAIKIYKEIVRQVGCDELHVIYWDHCVQRHEIYKFANGTTMSKTQPKGGGGTNFAPVLDYLKAEGIKPDVMVVTTDGYVSDYGRKPDYPILFVVSTDQSPPYGEVLRA